MPTSWARGRRGSNAAMRQRPTFWALLLVVGLSTMVGGCASGDSRDRYRVEVLDQPVSAGVHSMITVRLTDATTGMPVEGASISDARLRMRMPSTVSLGKGAWPERFRWQEGWFVGSTGAGRYRLVGDVPMPGTWTVHLVASVPGEDSPIEGTTTFVAARERHDP